MFNEFPTLIAAFERLWLDPQRAGRPALLDDDQQCLTYPALHATVGDLAGRLRTAGVGRGDRVALAMDRSTNLAVAILAVMAAGACPCPLEPKLGRDEIQRRFRMTGMTWTLVDASHADDPSLIDVPAERRLDLFGLPAAAPFWDTGATQHLDSFLLFTSGSSGKPKGVLQNHEGMRTNALGVVAHSRLDASDRLLHIMPLYHTNGVNNQLLAPLLAGSTVILCNRFKAEDMPALMERHTPTIVTGVPTMYSRMLPYEFSPASLAAVRMLRCGSAPITQELHKKIEAKFGRPLVVSYGLSEATCTSTMNPPGRRKIGSVGTVLPGQDVFLQGSGGKRLTEPGQDGEICIAGAILMTGYLEEGAGGVARSVGDTLHSGDLGRFDEEGYLFITGRIKDVIIRGGENLSPGLIEEAISAVAGVGSCCVVGRPDADLGEVPVAFVVPAPACREPLDKALLSAAVLDKLSRIHQPADYYFVDALPENAVGKVDRKRLATLVADGAALN